MGCILFLQEAIASFIHRLYEPFLPSFLPSLPACLPAFLPSFLSSFLFLFLYSFIRSFVRSFVRSVVCSFIRSFVHSLSRSFVHLFFLVSIPTFLYLHVAPGQAGGGNFKIETRNLKLKERQTFAYKPRDGLLCLAAAIS